MCLNSHSEQRALGAIVRRYWALLLHKDTRGDIAARHRSRQGLCSHMSPRTRAKMASLDVGLKYHMCVKQFHRSYWSYVIIQKNRH